MGTFLTIIIILTVLVVGGFTILIAFVINKSTTQKTQEFIENEKQEMRANVEKKRKELHPHKAALYSQVTDAMVFNYIKAVTYNKLSGVILNEKHKPIVSFERIERGLHTKGHMGAMTKKQTFYYDFTDLEATFYCDDMLLGRFDKTGTIYDATDKVIGHAKHPMKASFDLQLFTSSQHRLGEDFFPLTLNNRQLATINVAPNYDDIKHVSSVKTVFEELGFGTPIITLTDTPTAEEENWLTAFAIFETAFHGHWLIP
ncbi:hypothetical protein IMCC3317_04150 [Kordia antarctica]|uniref:Uncharacterized protein n=1 Tax=Kordia antarctica TaxID=1218801 RepID=A0A7L4ZEY0_9FLAO|nr:hypothetical protein [Kordia antarctica]QHI35069.1 hypothetical protein IMCC3317_04150 [Kordia antarctica]